MNVGKALSFIMAVLVVFSVMTIAGNSYAKMDYYGYVNRYIKPDGAFKEHSILSKALWNRASGN